MKSLIRLMIWGVLVTSVLVFTTQRTRAQDPVKVIPGKYKVLFENDRVRVLEFKNKPGDKGAMHSHPANVVYSFGPAKIRFSLPDGKTAEAELKAGEVRWSEAETHAGENIGTTDTHVLIFELKEAQKKMKK